MRGDERGEGLGEEPRTARADADNRDVGRGSCGPPDDVTRLRGAPSPRRAPLHQVGEDHQVVGEHGEPDEDLEALAPV